MADGSSVVGQVFVAATTKGVVRAARCTGSTWAVETILLGRPVRALAVDPLQSGVLYAGTDGEGVLRSDDAGVTGHRAGMPRATITALAGSPLVPEPVYAGTRPVGMWVSENRGERWAQPEIWYCSASPSPKKAHGDGTAEAFIFRSTVSDGWRKLSGGLPQPLPHMPYALLIDRAAPGHLYAGFSSGDVWWSTDCGDSWQQLPFNLDGSHRSLVLLNV